LFLLFLSFVVCCCLLVVVVLLGFDGSPFGGKFARMHIPCLL
jgi:hypothetical protein